MPRGKNVCLYASHTWQLGGRKTDGERWNLVRVLIAVTQSLPWPPQTTQKFCLPCSPISIYLPLSPAHKCGLRPLPRVEWQFQGLLNTWLFSFHYNQEPSPSKCLTDFLLRLHNKECVKFGKDWGTHLHLVKIPFAGTEGVPCALFEGRASCCQMCAAARCLGSAGSPRAFHQKLVDCCLLEQQCFFAGVDWMQDPYLPPAGTYYTGTQVES